MGLTQLNFAGLNKVEVAIMRLKEFEPPEGYYLAFSGGKDSTVIYDLVIKSGVKFDAHYHLTGIDPPELVQHIRSYYPTVLWDRPKESMWKLIYRKGLPSRIRRWCCDELKEGGGKGRRIISGIRNTESARRSKRRMFEACSRNKLTFYVHPIIDWTQADVWKYIHENKLPYCRLYDEGFKRLGCVMCPMTTKRQTKEQIARWPKIADAWKRAALRYYDMRKIEKPESVKDWATFDLFWDWWIGRKVVRKDTSQCVMFE